MNKDNMNISKVESFMNTLLDDKVSSHTFFGNMIGKESINSEWNDMVLVEVPNGIYDNDAYAQGTALVTLYARPLGSGRKNVGVMSTLETKLNEAIESNDSNTYHVSRRQTYTYYDSDIDWHCNVVEINILIV